ncbi:MAG: TnsA endonuclease N-terminal domain-containing protein [Candidatus Heimdallarchaeota archaeon]
MCLDHDFHCVEIIPQPEIVWKKENGEEKKFYPDCWTAFYTNKWSVILFEVKTSENLRELMLKDQWNQKITAIELYCQEKGWEYRIVTEKHLQTVRLTNIHFFRSAVLIPPNKTFLDSIRKILPTLYQKRVEYSFSDLKQELFKSLKKTIPIHLIEKCLQSLLYFQELWFDWEKPFSASDTLIYLNFEHSFLLTPVFQIQGKKQTKEADNSTTVYSEFDIDLIPSKQMQEAKKRYHTIKPLLKIIDAPNKKLTRADVEKQAQNVGKNTVTLYRWLKIYRETRDWKGLISKDYRKGRRESRFSLEVETIIQTAIENRTPMTSIKACWEEIKEKCEENDYPVPSYKTISLRVRKTPASERKGKQGGYIRHEIPRTIVGKLPTGTEPLDFVQMDHTQLDIFLVDQLNPKVRKRPWLTLAVDVKTRMIYTWLLDFERPNSISVTRALVRGFLPKTELLKKFNLEMELSYPIYGVPRKIQVDNAREFDSQHTKEFCMLHGVEEFQFRSVRRPDQGGYVERMFRTLNEKIRDNGLPGYVPPLKKRPEGINPAKEARMTLPEFEAWLIRQVMIYHHTPHKGLEQEFGAKRSPIEQFRLDIAGRDPLVPQFPEMLQFEIFPPKKHILRPEGIIWKKNKYNKDGDSRRLTEIRRRNRGERKKILFRYDPLDITAIWIYDEIKQEYICVRVSGGLLSQFVRDNPHTPVRLSELELATKQLREEKRPETPENVAEILKESKRIVKESKKRQKRIRRIQTQEKTQQGSIDVIEDKEEGNDDLFDELEEDDDDSYTDWISEDPKLRRILILSDEAEDYYEEEGEE